MLSCLIKAVFSVGLCLEILIRENLFYVKKKNWIKSHRQILQGNVTPHQNSGKKRSIARRHSFVRTLTSAIRALQSLRKRHKTKPCTKKDYSWRDLLQKKVNLVLQRWSNLASRKLMRRSSKFRRIQCTTQKKLSLIEKGSGMAFLPTSLSKGTLQAETSKLVERLVNVIMIKMNEKLTALFVGILWVQYCGEYFRSPEGEISRTQICFKKRQDFVSRHGETGYREISAVQGPQ